jgi:hypothetical protein
MVQDAHEYLAAGATFVQTEVVVITVITLASFFFLSFTWQQPWSTRKLQGCWKSSFC